MFQAARVAIETQDGRTFKFGVEMAITRAEQERGLMFRKSIAPDHGMLFDFHTPRHIAMWMSNTYIPLDMLFVDADGRIVHIARHTKPLSEKLIMADRPVRYVLEVAAGTAERLNLAVGDRLHRLE